MTKTHTFCTCVSDEELADQAARDLGTILENTCTMKVYGELMVRLILTATVIKSVGESLPRAEDFSIDLTEDAMKQIIACAKVD